MKQLRFATVLFVALLAGAGGLMPLPCEAASWPGFECGMGIGGKEDGLNFQGLIDEAAANGGGRVVVPAGRHLVGQIDLRSNVELYLEKGAVLEGKVGLENYRVTTLPYSENYGDRPCAWRRETAGTSPAR